VIKYSSFRIDCFPWRVLPGFIFHSMDIPTLETARLRLRAFTLEDWGPYAEMYADQSFVRFLEGRTLSRDEVWENIAIILGHWTLRGYGIWALECKETGQLIGRAGLLNLPQWPDAEVCWALSPRFWGRGYATEAGQASVHWAFQEAGLGRLISLIHPENKASEAVALRLGEQFRERITFDGKPANVYEIVNAGRI
jgi:RimJ/RimL family protein N-acetyltransferase